jgi:hypothetical protein
LASSLLLFAVLLPIAGCDHEKIVESTEYIRETEYLPGDTVRIVDTVYSNDSTSVTIIDTVMIIDTVVQQIHTYDTIRVHDTVVTVQNHYDTTVVTDTVLTIQCAPSESFAVTAMQYYADAEVLAYINSEFAITDGWVFYLSTFQLDLTRQNQNVYDMYGYIDYWTPDWSGFYALEFYWELTYTGGDPADPANWVMSEPPAAGPAHQTPGIRVIPQETRSSLRLK